MARILVIDDTKNIRKMIKLALTHSGHDIVEAEDGAQGLELFGDGSGWDLALIDQRMPEIQGVDVVREARERDPKARIIMMTAFASHEVASQVLRLGALDFLRKPFTTTTLRGAVETALAMERVPQAPACTPEGVSSDWTEFLLLPQPGEPGFIIPRLSYRLNGYSFWPVQSAQGLSVPRGMEIGRFFQVRSPDGDFTLTFAGITHRIKQQFQQVIGREVPEDDQLWDKVCGQALLNFIWETSQTPPEVLPVYELPANLHHRAPVQWT